MARNRQQAAQVVEEPKVEETKPEVIRPEDLAKELDVSGKQIRAFLRQTFPRAAEQKRSSWYLTKQQADAVRERFTPSEDDESEEIDLD